MGHGDGGITAPLRTRRKRPMYEPPRRFENVQHLVVQADAEYDEASRRLPEAHEPALREVGMNTARFGHGGSEILAKTVRVKANRLGRQLGLPPSWRVIAMPYRLTCELEPALVFEKNGDGD